MPISLVGMPDA